MPSEPQQAISYNAPTVAEGAVLHSIAVSAGELDVNSSYAYLLWCRDFSATSVVASNADGPVGFITGYFRPDEPETLFVWQVAVVDAARGQGVASSMLRWLTDETEAATLETTITSDNLASIALFERFASSRGADLHRAPLFSEDDFPDGHSTEYLYTIGPLHVLNPSQ